MAGRARALRDGRCELKVKRASRCAGARDNYGSALALGGSHPLPELFEVADTRLAFDAATITPLIERIGDELSTLPA